MKLLFLIITVVFLSSCEQKDVEMSIEPIVDIYGIQNKSIPINDLFHIEGFKDDKKSIIKIFDYADNQIKPILPFNHTDTIATFVFDKDDIEFDDTAAFLRDGVKSMSICFYEKDYNYFSYIVFIRNYQKLSYQVKNKKIIIDYEEFDSRALQTFIDIVENIHKKTKQKKFILVQKRSNRIEARIVYIDIDAFTFELISLDVNEI